MAERKARASEGLKVGHTDPFSVPVGLYKLCRVLGVGEQSLIREVLANGSFRCDEKRRFLPDQANKIAARVEQLRKDGVLLPRRNHR